MFEKWSNLILYFPEKKSSIIFGGIGLLLGLFINNFIIANKELWQNVDLWVKIATIINACAVFGVSLLWFQIKAEHERSRREKAVDLLLKWNDSLKKETSLARKIVEGFSLEQCRCLYKQESFKVSGKHYKTILEIMECHEDQDKEISDDNDADLTQGEISKLRWLVLSYLNMFESILVAWQYSVADRGIIEAQFSYLFDTAHGYDALSNFRMACGGESSYPAIESFTAHVRDEQRKRLIKKGNVA